MFSRYILIFLKTQFVLKSVIFFWQQPPSFLWICMDPPLYAVPDLPIGSIGRSIWPQNLGDLRPRCILFLTLLLDFHTYAVISYCTFYLNNPSVIFLTQLVSISEYCRILNTPHHLPLYWNWLNTPHVPPVVKMGNWEESHIHKWNSLGPLFI